MNVKPYPPKASQIPRDTTLTAHYSLAQTRPFEDLEQNEATGRDSEVTPGHVTGELRGTLGDWGFDDQLRIGGG
jgi:hypothetical protein